MVTTPYLFWSVGTMLDHQNDINKDVWYAVYTKPRQEFRAKEQLMNQGVGVFLPTIPTYKKKKITGLKSQILFPRYLFIKANLTQIALTTLRSTRGVASILSSQVDRKPILIRQVVIDAIEKLIQEWEEPPKVRVGQTVIISEGPAKGISGVVQKLRVTTEGDERAFLLIDFLNKPQLWEMSITQINPSH